jgi:hypothetical protein
MRDQSIKLMPDMDKSDIRRFNSRYIESESGCHEWSGSLKGGYSHMRVGGLSFMAHRLSYHINNGPIEDGMFVCHRCDNRKCVRPDHLFLGTHQDNMDDMMAKGRGNRSWDRKGELGNINKISKADVILAAGLLKEKSNNEIALIIGHPCTGDIIKHIRSGRSWRSVTGFSEPSNVIRPSISDIIPLFSSMNCKAISDHFNGSYSRRGINTIRLKYDRGEISL